MKKFMTRMGDGDRVEMSAAEIQEDLEAGAQGRNRPIVLGQVGIRCRHCAQLPHRQKQRAFTKAYYKQKPLDDLDGLEL